MRWDALQATIFPGENGRTRGKMASSDLMKFWKLLADAGFTGMPSDLIEDDVWQMGLAAGWSDSEIEAAVRGYREFLKTI